MKNKKSFMIAFLSMALLSTAVSVSVFADSDVVSISAEKITAQPSSDFQLEILFSEIPVNLGVDGIEFAVKYDSSIIEISNAVSNNDSWKVADNLIDSENGFANLIFATNSENRIKDSEIQVSLIGKVKDTAQIGDVSAINIVPIERSEYSESKINVGYTDGKNKLFYDTSITNGEIYIDYVSSPNIFGDANCDDKISVADAVAVSAYVSNSEKNSLSESGIINSDVHLNGNGLNANDALTIQQFATGIVDSLPIS